jgi:hypothetical protein
MHEILPRTAISNDARNAAERSIAHGAPQPNPYVPGSAEHAAWVADYARWRLALIAGEDTEAGA